MIYKSVLIISDTHIPYSVPELLPFLKQLKKKYKNFDKVIHIGDEVDKHAMSFHDSDPDLPSAGDELKISLPMIKELEKLFPQMDLMDSNHGSLVYRRALKHGIPKAYIRKYNEFLQEIEHMLALHYYAGSKFDTKFWKNAKLKSKIVLEKAFHNRKFQNILQDAMFKKIKSNGSYGSWATYSYLENIKGLGLYETFRKYPLVHLQ